MDGVTSPPRTGSAAADRLEPRALRTRALVFDAVRASLDERSLDALTVAELCRRAGVHRVTFYRHWPDVRAAAVDAFTDEIDRLAAIDPSIVAAAPDAAALAGHFEEALVAQLIEIRDHRGAYRTLLESPGFSRVLLDRLAARAAVAVQALVRLGAEVPGAASGIAAAHLAGGVVAASARWAGSDARDVEIAANEFLAQLPGWWPRA